MKIFKIVLTGGPCSGKSEIMKKIIKYYSEREDCKVFPVAETASEVLNSNIKFIEMDNPINFQDIILDRQLNKENTINKGIQHTRLNDINLVVFDRGIIDNKAYLQNQQQFDYLLDKYNLKELSILDNYDLVIDLISLATVHPDKYECQTNEQRYEDVETAKNIDRKTTNAWLGHKNLKVVYPTNSIDEKFQIVSNYINDLINNKQKSEKETYLIEECGALLEFFDDNNSKLIEIEDIYFEQFNDNKYIARKRKYKDSETYSFLLKNNKHEILMDKQIDKNSYELMKNLYSIKYVINKRELSFFNGKNIYKIGFYDDFTILEVEKNNCLDKIVIPSFINAIEKIDDFESFYNKKRDSFTKKKKVC